MAGRANGGKGGRNPEDKSLVLALDLVVCPKRDGISALPRREEMNSIQSGIHIILCQRTHTR
jgi:hypothetical protein